MPIGLAANKNVLLFFILRQMCYYMSIPYQLELQPNYI